MMKRATVVGALGVVFALASGCVNQVVGGGHGTGGAGGGVPGEEDSGGYGPTVTSTSSGEGVCWKDFGPDAPGDCKIGDERDCPEDSSSSTGGYASSSNGGYHGFDFCREKCVNIKGKAVWGAQTHRYECEFYDTDWHLNNGPNCYCNTPLVLSFDDRPVTFTAEAMGSFDLTRDGVCHASDWPTGKTPWLALDRNGDGAINDGGELFGSATKLAGGGFAQNGFEALRELDDNHDGTFDARDAAFAKVVVWTDRDLDRQSTARELRSLTEAGVTAIDLHDYRETRCDARGNCEGERSELAFTDAAGAARRGVVIDVYLPTR